MSQSHQFFSWKPTDGISCVPVGILFTHPEFFLVATLKWPSIRHRLQFRRWQTLRHIETNTIISVTWVFIYNYLCLALHCFNECVNKFSASQIWKFFPSRKKKHWKPNFHIHTITCRTIIILIAPSRLFYWERERGICERKKAKRLLRSYFMSLDSQWNSTRVTS
jgi:hypothetical protein